MTIELTCLKFAISGYVLAMFVLGNVVVFGGHSVLVFGHPPAKKKKNQKKR